MVPTRSLRRCTLARRIYIVRKQLDAGAVPGERAGLVLFAVQEGDAELLQRLLSDLPVDVDAPSAAIDSRAIFWSGSALRLFVSAV